MVRRIGAFVYGVACYALFLGTFLYAIGFVGNVVVPKAMASGREGSLAAALLTNLALLTIESADRRVGARPIGSDGGRV